MLQEFVNDRLRAPIRLFQDGLSVAPKLDKHLAGHPNMVTQPAKEVHEFVLDLHVVPVEVEQDVCVEDH
jgi:hypothetical protein